MTYVNYPPPSTGSAISGFCAFNVYLESQQPLESYLGRLQNIAGDRPLVMAEVGLDSRRHGEITKLECWSGSYEQSSRQAVRER